uniref:Uncharacterized protein n=1 Tax=Panagrellus redivivus TaxID=6233 RepID=A0A7E4VU81_PANRE
MAGDHPDDKIVSFKKDEPFQLQLLSTMRYFTELFIFGLFSEISAVFINPYSYGSYDPAAENPQTYQYYARYFNPNPHNPYAPYPTHMKPGRFTLPRMYQIDPAYASRYPPNYAETLPYATYPQQQQGKHSPRRRNNLNLSRGRESVAVFPDGCGQSSQSSGNEGGNQAIFGQYRRRPSNSIRRSMRIKGRSHRRSQGGGRRRFYPKSETELLLDRLDGKNGGGTKRKITPPTPKKPKPQPKSETQLLLERLDRGGGVRPTPNGNGRGIQPKSETQLLLERLDGGGGWGTPKSETQLLLERLDAGSNVFVTGNAYSSGISKNKYGRPRWIDTQPSPDVTAKFAASSGVVRPRLRGEIVHGQWQNY